MDMYKYEVGQKILPPGPDGVRFDVADSGGSLLIQMVRPTAAEKRAFKSGISIRLSVVDQIIFILIRMGTLNWMDAPYYRHFSQSLTRPEYPPEGEGAAIHAMLVDGATGILVGQKLIGLDHKASESLIAAIAAQPVIPDYNTRLQRIFAEYGTDDLPKEAIQIF